MFSALYLGSGSYCALWRAYSVSGLLKPFVECGLFVNVFSRGLSRQASSSHSAVWNQIYGAFVLNRRVDLHAIDATRSMAWRCRSHRRRAGTPRHRREMT